MTDQPRTIAEYLEALRRAFGSADPALIQDALYDAEEYLQAELAQRGRPEAEVIAELVESYGAPEEVAAAYAQTEATVQRALTLKPVPRPGVARTDGQPPAAVPERSLFARFFGVYAEPRAYASLFYMLLASATGIFYFTWATVGLALSAGLMILIIGIPFLLLFLGSVRVLSLVEGRIVETLLGERMPRRPPYPTPQPFLERLRDMVTDLRTWSTIAYMLLMMPLGVGYLMLAIIGLTLPIALMVLPIVGLYHGDTAYWHHHDHWLLIDDEFAITWWQAVLAIPLGILGAALTLHMARGIGWLHGQMAKALLVRL
jgi:uncharacterized membrane protein